MNGFLGAIAARTLGGPSALTPRRAARFEVVGCNDAVPLPGDVRESMAWGREADTLDYSAGAARQQLASGFYYLTVKSPQTANTSRHVLLVSDMNVTLKTSDDEALVWVTDLQTGQPVAGVTVDVYDRNGDVVGSGTTDADGVSYASIGRQDPWSSLMVIASSLALLAVCLGTYTATSLDLPERARETGTLRAVGFLHYTLLRVMAARGIGGPLDDEATDGDGRETLEAIRTSAGDNLGCGPAELRTTMTSDLDPAWRPGGVRPDTSTGAALLQALLNER